METIMKTPSVTEEDLALINALTKSPLAAEQVYTFAVRLCDNEIDRDYERFSKAALEKLAGLFVGKSGIFDHQWTAKGQSARLYKTELVEEDGQTSAGERYCYLKGWAYMLRNEQTEGLIADIEAGIKKEVSVGCAMRRSTCSICGQEAGRCVHRKGAQYEGRTCYFTLEDPTDAYEWSFVAVPAQRRAGVVKGMSGVTLTSADVDRIAGRLAERLKAILTSPPGDPPPAEPTEETKLARARLELEKIRFGGI